MRLFGAPYARARGGGRGRRGGWGSAAGGGARGGGGTSRGCRAGRRGYGGLVFGAKGIARAQGYGGYEPLLVEIARFFRTGVPPVSADESLEIFAFMEAADESKRRDGAEVTLKEVLDKARAQLAGK